MQSKISARAAVRPAFSNETKRPGTPGRGSCRRRPCVRPHPEACWPSPQFGMALGQIVVARRDREHRLAEVPPYRALSDALGHRIARSDTNGAKAASASFLPDPGPGRVDARSPPPARHAAAGAGRGRGRAVRASVSRPSPDRCSGAARLQEKGPPKGPWRFANRTRSLTAREFVACRPVAPVTGPKTADGRVVGRRGKNRPDALSRQLQPEVPPQVLHFMQVPLRTSV